MLMVIHSIVVDASFIFSSLSLAHNLFNNPFKSFASDKVACGLLFFHVLNTKNHSLAMSPQTSSRVWASTPSTYPPRHALWCPGVGSFWDSQASIQKQL